MRELELVVHPSIDPRRSPRAGERARFPLSRAGVRRLDRRACARGLRVEPAGVAEREPCRPRSPSFSCSRFRGRGRADVAPAARAGGAAARDPRAARACRSHRRGRPSRSRSRPPSSSRARSCSPRRPPQPRADHRLRRGATARREADRHGARAEKEYLTFSIDDVAAPRPVEEPEPERSIFDRARRLARSDRRAARASSARSSGARMSELCNALTGGFSLMGFGSFCAAATRGAERPVSRGAAGVPGPDAGVRRDARHGAALALESPVPDREVPSRQARGLRGPTLRFLVACKESAAGRTSTRRGASA